MKSTTLTMQVIKVLLFSNAQKTSTLISGRMQQRTASQQEGGNCCASYVAGILSLQSKGMKNTTMQTTYTHYRAHEIETQQ